MEEKKITEPQKKDPKKQEAGKHQLPADTWVHGVPQVHHQYF